MRYESTLWTEPDIDGFLLVHNESGLKEHVTARELVLAPHPAAAVEAAIKRLEPRVAAWYDDHQF